MGAAGPVTLEVELKVEDNLMEILHLTKLAASPELVHQVVEVMKKAPEGMYHTCLLNNIYF